MTALYECIAAVMLGLMAWDAFRRWVNHREATLKVHTRIEAVERLAEKTATDLRTTNEKVNAIGTRTTLARS